MDDSDRDIEMRQLDHIKDTAIAEFQARAAWWNGLVTGGLAAAGLVAVGFLQGTLDAGPAGALLGVSLATAGGASHGLAREKRSLEKEMRSVVREFEKLKRRRNP